MQRIAEVHKRLTPRLHVTSMASRRVLGSIGGGATARSSPADHAKAATSVCRAAFASAVNNGDPAPATGSEEDKERSATDAGDGGPAAADVGRKAKGAAEEVKEAGRDVKDRAKEVGEDVKETIKETR